MNYQIVTGIKLERGRVRESESERGVREGEKKRDRENEQEFCDLISIT